MITLLLKSSVIIILLLAFYKLFLEKESFFAVNRAYLLACLGLAFVLPFIVLPQLVEHQGYVETLIESEKATTKSAIAIPTIKFEEPIESIAPIERTAPIEKAKSIAEIAVDGKKNSSPKIAKHNNKFEQLKETLIGYLQENTLGDWLLLFYFFGVIVLSLNLVAQVANMVLKVIRNEDKILDDDGIIVNMNAIIEPCSFFNYIFINPASYDFETYEQIIAHEKIHVAKGHTYDLLLAELAVIVLWFNPFIWLFRKEVEKNIEYQTDDLLVNTAITEKENYQMSLLKIATYNKPLTVVTNYNQSLIKQRILKMNSKKSTQFSYWKYAFLAPLLFAMLLFLNKPVSVYAATKDGLTEMGDQTNTSISTSTTLVAAEPEVIIKKRSANKATSTTKAKNNKSVTTVTTTTTSVIDDEQTVQEKRNPSDCEKLLNAAKQGKIEQIVKILSTFDADCMPYGTERDQQNMIAINKVATRGGEIMLDPEGGTITVKLTPQNYAIINLNELVEGESISKNFKANLLQKIDAAKAYHEEASDANVIIHVNDQTVSYQSDRDREENYIYDNDCQSLLVAVRTNNNAKVKELLKTIDPNCVNPNEEYEEEKVGKYTWRRMKARTPLVAAARHGNLEGGKLLIAAGAKVKFHHRNNESPIIAAAEFGDLDFVKYLLDKGAELDESSNSWGSPLNAAARGGHTAIVDFLIAKGAPLNEQTNGQGSALNAAAREGHIETVKMLISKGVNLNMQNNGQGSALNAAARNGHLEVAKLLIEAGADLDASTNGQGSALNAAARNGNVKMVELLLSKGADIDEETNGQGSALNAAARNGNVEMIKLLIAKGANLDASTNGQGSALNAAARNGNMEVVKLLLEKGANINEQTNGQGSALNAAARNGNDEMVTFLIEKGANIDLQNNGQGSALNAAARNGHISTAKLLLAKGADVNAMTNGQGTPLMAATKNQIYDMAELLLENGADPYLSPGHQSSPNDIAHKKGNRKLIKLFRAYEKEY